MKRLRPMCYRDALQWLVNNDDTEWTRENDPIISVTAALVADIYDRTNEEVTADLRKALKDAGR